MDSQNSSQRERLGSRLGFLLLSAGCAIGLGNVWRFPTITGQYGGAFFVLFYLLFLVTLGLPVMIMELSLGRAGKSSMGNCYRTLTQSSSGNIWGALGYASFFGNLLLLMFYSVITGWLLSYTWDFMTGTFQSMELKQVESFFGQLLGNWKRQILFMGIVVALSSAICFSGLKNGVERITKIMMFGLFLLILSLAVYACLLPGAADGLKFFLKPNAQNLSEQGVWPAIHAAMTQAFFTLSLGIGAIAIFGSYIGKEKSLALEGSIIVCLDTFVAICAGIIIFPCCFSFNISPDAGPPLVFITLPRIFLQMQYGQFFGTIFFLFLTIAALTTLIAVTENLTAFGIDQFKLSRKTSATAIGILLFVMSLPCLFGYNLLSSFKPFGENSAILDLEDFLVSDNLLPLGSLCLVLFCTHDCGWGFKNFLKEANTGDGYKISTALHFYLKWILPLLIFCIWAYGICKKFHLL